MWPYDRAFVTPFKVAVRDFLLRVAQSAESESEKLMVRKNLPCSRGLWSLKYNSRSWDIKVYQFDVNYHPLKISIIRQIGQSWWTHNLESGFWSQCTLSSFPPRSSIYPYWGKFYDSNRYNEWKERTAYEHVTEWGNIESSKHLHVCRKRTVYLWLENGLQTTRKYSSFLPLVFCWTPIESAIGSVSHNNYGVPDAIWRKMQEA